MGFSALLEGVTLTSCVLLQTLFALQMCYLSSAWYRVYTTPSLNPAIILICQIVSCLQDAVASGVTAKIGTFAFLFSSQGLLGKHYVIIRIFIGVTLFGETYCLLNLGTTFKEVGCGIPLNIHQPVPWNGLLHY